MGNIFNFENLNLDKRLGLLVLLPIILSIIFGIVVFNTLDKNKQTLNEITNRSDTLLLSNKLLTIIHGKIREPILSIDNGRLTWEAGLKKLTKSRAILDTQMALFKKLNAKKIIDKDPDIIASINALPSFLAAFDHAIEIVKKKNKTHLKLFIVEDMHEEMSTFVKSITIQQRKNIKNSNQKINDTLNTTTIDENIILGLLAINLLFLALFGYLVFRSISKQTQSLTSTIDELNRGNTKARTAIKGKHELAQLGTALNQLLDEKDVTEKKIQQENEVLNDSVFSLLESVADLSERNLTVRATVTEDATGPLADAINQLAIDTNDVLIRVRDIAVSVESASKEVDHHTLTVKKLADSERSEAQQTSTAVKHLIERLNQIADSSLSANTMANETTQATEKAYESVSKTVDSMTEIRETVQETGKRIKRLGERSQEITHIIDLINTIAERTTVLALNANMQALSAGDAGKGFSVIAEEIQRLAESSRESTEQISSLIKNIQQETRTTMSTMDNTIEQVINGSSLAEEASAQMQLTLDATKKLTQSVESIAQASKDQVDISQDLYHRSTEILKATQQTGQEMESLSHLTENMVNDAQDLVQSVNVFTLEKIEKETPTKIAKAA
ncbi:MAG TPA: methyl-accepting chemotaxis protein [Leucothrix mucor]|nr:methyl-accepting chemotaxis protein [Leucothrix mucor]